MYFCANTSRKREKKRGQEINGHRFTCRTRNPDKFALKMRSLIIQEVPPSETCRANSVHSLIDRRRFCSPWLPIRYISVLIRCRYPTAVDIPRRVTVGKLIGSSRHSVRTETLIRRCATDYETRSVLSTATRNSTTTTATMMTTTSDCALARAGCTFSEITRPVTLWLFWSPSIIQRVSALRQWLHHSCAAAQILIIT